jgi:hypothetical protein
LLRDVFLTERRILENVTPDTIRWYDITFQRLDEHVGERVEKPTLAQVKSLVSETIATMRRS